MTTMTIGEVVQKTAIPASTLRYYESIGLIPAPPRQNGRRLYDETILRQLAGIQLARRAGWTLAEIKTLLDDFPARWASTAQKKMADLDRLIAQAQEMKLLLAQGLACECTALDDCDLLIQT